MEDEKIFAVQLGYFVNEINMLYKCIRIKADLFFINMFIRLLAGKLYEAWQMINNANKNEGLSKRLEKILSDETKAIRKKINKYFGGKNNIKIIRNHLGFHYDQEIIKKGLTEIKKQALMFFTSEYAENNFYAFSELVIYEALKKEIVCLEGKDFLFTFLHETGEVCDWFSKFAMNCLDEIAKANSIDLESEVINIPEPPTYKEIKFPFFIQRDEDE